jgi:hypothetical protein
VSSPSDGRAVDEDVVVALAGPLEGVAQQQVARSMSMSSSSAPTRAGEAGHTLSVGSAVGTQHVFEARAAQEHVVGAAGDVPGRHAQARARVALRVHVDQQHALLRAASEAAALTLVVVFPTPPFWFAIA